MPDSKPVRLEPIDITELPQPDNLFQGRLWAELKREFAWTPAAFHLEWRSRRAPLLTLVRRAENGLHLAYVPAGPDIDADDDEQGRLLETLSEELAAYLPRSTAYIRYDLPWPTPYVEPAPGQPVERVSRVRRPDPRIRELRMNFGTSRRNLRKAWTDVQPTDTILLDLLRGAEALLSAMRPKTRYNIRLAERRGVRVRRASPDRLPDFFELYAQTAQRNGIRLHDYHYFEEILEVAGRGSVPATAELLIAGAGDEPLAAMVMAVTGSRATYLYGASSDRSRSLMPTYALQWAAINRAIELGCDEYDLYGIPPSDDPAHPMHGLYRFKTGFGGRFMHRRGCWDFALSPDAYEEIRGRELSGAGYHLC